MLRVLFALVAGIALAIVLNNVYHISAVGAYAAALIMLLLLLAAIWTGSNNSAGKIYKYRLYSGVSITVALVALGYLIVWTDTGKSDPHHFSHQISPHSVLLVQIDEPPVERDKIIVANAQVKEVINEHEKVAATGRIQLNILKDSTVRKPEYGDMLLTDADVAEVAGPKNPCEFDFKAYLNYHQIYYSTFLTSAKWKLTDSTQGDRMFVFIYHLRDKFLQVIKAYVPGKNDFGVASAIMLGYRDYVNADVMKAYADSGTLHVLSVSGLHVGIMFLMLNFLLGWMDNKGMKFAFAKAGLIIIFIWFYACITGLSPPVMRSAMMFSLIQTGRVLNRHVNIYNIIAGSAVILLLFNPYNLVDVGFQLSYLAVAGIVYLQPRLASVIVIGTVTGKGFIVRIKQAALWIADFVWQLIAASVAAQIITLPLSILYFNQFPNLFLLANLVVIPLSNFVLFTGTALFAFAHVPYLGAGIGWVFNGLLSVLDKFIFTMDELPFTVVRGVSINATEMVLMYMLILLVYWLAEERKPKVVLASLAVLLALCSFRTVHEVENNLRKQLVVYSVPKCKAIACISGKQLYSDFDSVLLNDNAAMSFHILHHWWQCGVTDTKPACRTRLPVGYLISFEGRNIWVVDAAFERGKLRELPKMHADVLVLSGSPVASITDLQQAISFDEVVFDSNNKPKRREAWAAECRIHQVAYWDVNYDGAYIKDYARL
jgi:competence protein ComEC